MAERIDEIIEIMRELKEIETTMRAHVHHHFRDVGLTAPQGMLVMSVRRHGELKISQISEILGLSNSTVSGIVDRLEDMGYVERQRSKEDRRVVKVVLTEKMEACLSDHHVGVRQIMNNALNKATDQEFNDVKYGLKTLGRLLKEVSHSTEGE